jgi:hypothetical protein
MLGISSIVYLFYLKLEDENVIYILISHNYIE